VSVAPTVAFPLPSRAASPIDGRPRIRRGAVRRDRLLRTLMQSSATPLVVVRAPAGYGKTTLLSQWSERDERPFAWMSLDPGPRATTLAAATRLLRTLPQPGVAVLDGAELDAGRDELEAWARELPAGSQLVVATRQEPPLPLGSLRAQGLLVELGAPQLAMTRREATAMLSMAGAELDPGELAALLRRTEGWPAALYLAALSVRSGDDPQAALTFSGEDRLMADYLRDEILMRLGAPAVDFLLRTSVLASLSGPACDAVAERAGSGATLRELWRQGVPMLPLDRGEGLYRYHPLLAEMLRAEQQRRNPLRAAGLHRRAGAWLEREGDVDGALAHALASGDLAAAGARLWSVAGRRIGHGDVDDIRAWLDRFRPEQLSGHATLALAAAASHLVDGDRDRMEHRLDAAERLIAAGPAERGPEAAAAAALRAVLARDGIAAMAAGAATAYELTSQGDPWRPLACLARGAGLHLRGDPARAAAALDEGARRGGVVAPAVQVLCLAQLALLRIDQGDWEEAALLATRARGQLERTRVARYPLSALAYAVSALTRAHRDRVDAAQEERRLALELLERLVDPPPWYVVGTRVALARTALRLGDAAGCRAMLAEAQRALRVMAGAPTAAAWIEECRDQVDAFSSALPSGPASLTPAELRVLRMLPTHLSFREMGLDLHVTANTVKTHAHAVYRKLDASSRSEAVLHARAIGLIDGSRTAAAP
jgi:LuxR family maltose regulon positive regulatory protein